MIGAALLIGCAGPPAADVCSDPAAPTWDNFAQGYIQTWCTPCHAAALTGADRQGAPPGLDLDTYADVVAWGERIAEAATGPSPTMPPLGGVDPADVARLGDWLACGAPGQDPPPDPCVDPVVGPASTVGNQADADALCAAYDAVAGLTVTATATLPCLCRVAGPLVHQAGSLDVPILAEVTGDATVTAGAVGWSAGAWSRWGGS